MRRLCVVRDISQLDHRLGNLLAVVVRQRVLGHFLQFLVLFARELEIWKNVDR